MTLKTLLMSAAAAALMAGSATAQEETTGTDTQTGTTAETGTETAAMPSFTDIRDMTVGEAIGWDVYGPEGAKIGDVDYILEEAGKPVGVIGVGGFLGLGEYTVAIPLSEFEIGSEGMSFTLDEDKESLKARPEYDESDAESLPDETRIADLLESEDDGDTESAAEATESEEGATASEEEDTASEEEETGSEEEDTASEEEDTGSEEEDTGSEEEDTGSEEEETGSEDEDSGSADEEEEEEKKTE